MPTQIESASRPRTGTVLEFIEFVLPGAKEDKCPPWPPDVFAVVATIMRHNGAYVRCVPTGLGASGSDNLLLDAQWPEHARKVGREWRDALNDTLAKCQNSDKRSIRDVIADTPLPQSVMSAWKTLLQHAANVAMERSAENNELARALIQLSGYADEASYGIGLGFSGDSHDRFEALAQLLLNINRRQSMCNRVDREKARVLGKKHTPQQGLTLRSLTHHLSLCMPWEVEPQWFVTSAPHLDDVLNLLLLPWPLEVDSRHFRCINGPVMQAPREHRLFKYEREPISEKKLREDVTAAIDRALKRVSVLHAVVLPELALTCAEWTIVEEIAMERGLMLISGIIDDVDETSGLPMNSCRVQMMTLPISPREQRDAKVARQLPAFRQAKHHRWCLDRNQVLQYDLGGQLPSPLRCWEDSHIGRRGIFFAHLGGWLTFSVLICEDLARQDPIAEVLRSVGPNLVIALLMDGPQLAQRWSARYASVLADDPGTSVLTLTSLGMCVRSRPAGNGQPGSRVIALWKDKLYGTHEITISKGSMGCVLSIARERREEFTADGRSDHKGTEVPVFSGVFEI